jgi:hypothetical protein
VEQRVACPECRLFVDAVKGIRDPSWQARRRARRRQSYRTGATRGDAVIVSGQFFDLLRDETCARWLDHLADQDDPREHTHELPAWIARLPTSVDFGRKVGRDAAASVAAAVLGVSTRSVYRGLDNG